MDAALPLPGLRLRGLEPGDEARIAHLFERVHGRRVPEAHLVWKLATRGSSVENVFLALEGERPVFVYGGIPTRMRLLGREVDAMLSVDAMTDPDYRKRGLLTEVARRAYDAWRRAGVAFTYGLPNEQWGSRKEALGWRRLFPLSWRLRVLRPEAFLARRIGAPALGRAGLIGRVSNAAIGLGFRPDAGVALREVTRAEQALDQVWDAAAGAGVDVCAARDAAWVAWRYLDARPRYDVLLAVRAETPVGWAAFRVVPGDAGPVGVVADVFAPRDAGAARTLLAGALVRLHARGADRALALAVPGTPADRLLASAGFLRRRGSFSVELVPLAEDLPMDALADPFRWHLAGGDFDVV